MPGELVYKDLQRGNWSLYRISHDWTLISAHTRKGLEEEKKRQEEERTGLHIMAFIGLSIFLIFADQS